MAAEIGVRPMPTYLFHARTFSFRLTSQSCNSLPFLNRTKSRAPPMTFAKLNAGPKLVERDRPAIKARWLRCLQKCGKSTVSFTVTFAAETSFGGDVGNRGAAEQGKKLGTK
jgi:hypothetical protein